MKRHTRSNDIKAELAQAASRQNERLLDNLGLCINIATLSTWARFRDAQDKLYGAGWLGRFWCLKLRPRLMPKRQRLYRAEYDIAQAAHRVEYMKAVLALGEEMGYT